MGLLLFVVVIGQASWRKQKANQAAPNDGAMVDNKVIPADKNEKKSVQPGELLAQNPAAGVQPIDARDLKLPDAQPLLDGETKRLFGGVSSKLFADLSDDSTYRGDEIKPLFTLLKKLHDSDERDIELASTGRRTFVQLHEQPNIYRGEIVTVGGTVERIIPQQNPEPFPQGIAKQYEVWIKPDGGRLPIVALCLNLPADYPIGEKPEVDVSGYYFKRLGYPSAEKATAADMAKGMTNVYRSSPLILAKTLRLRPKAVVAAVVAEDEGPAFLKGVRLPFPNRFALPILGGGMVLLTALSAWAYRISRTSVMAAGPVVGRHRLNREKAEAEQEEVKNLNSLKVEP